MNLKEFNIFFIGEDISKHLSFFNPNGASLANSFLRLIYSFCVKGIKL
jgi:hypothetical protein